MQTFWSLKGLKEELKSGRSIINSIDLGYKFAVKTILDANFTTLIAKRFFFSTTVQAP